MRLYVRVFTHFFSHRKTAKLKSMIGDDAFWLPIKLWSYAAENQPDGNFSSYSAQDIAMLVGYTKDATSMLQALVDSGFMDSEPVRIHDWAEHNGFHETFSKRAKTAATARWEREKDPHPKREKGTGYRDRASMTQACSKHESKTPTIEEVKLSAAKNGISEADAEWFWNKCQGNGWTNGGKPIKSWVHTMASWKAAGYLPSQKNATANKRPMNYSTI